MPQLAGGLIGRTLTLIAAAALVLAPARALAERPPAPAPPAAPAGLPDALTFQGPYLSACGITHDNMSIEFTTTDFGSLMSCNFNVSRPGHALVTLTASLGAASSTDAYEANFRLNHNSQSNGLFYTDRYLDIVPDSALLAGGDGTDRSLSITALVTTTVGVNIFSFMGRRTDGDDPVFIYQASLSALFIPSDATDLQVCGATYNGAFITTVNTMNDTIGCSLDAPRPGRVFAIADGWLGYNGSPTAPYEARAQIWMDDTQPGSTGLRYGDVATDTVDGLDVSLAASNVFNVAAGPHSFTLYYARQFGTGSVSLMDPGLAALYVPDDSPFAHACADPASGLWTNTTTTFTTLADCVLDAPADGWAFVSGTASTGLAANPNNQPYEALYGLGLDGLSPEFGTDRFINSYPNTNDGVDASVAASLLTGLSAGPHHFYLSGRRFSAAAATALARHPVLFVLVPGAAVHLPAVQR